MFLGGVTPSWSSQEWMKVFTHHRVENRDKKAEAQVILAFLIVPVLAGRPRFCLVAPVGLTVGLAIGGAVSTGGDVAVGLSGFSWWNLLSSFQRCCTAEAGSQVFSFSG